MNCFDPSQLPVLNALAKEFVMCDNWFSSLSEPTFPKSLLRSRIYIRGLGNLAQIVSVPLQSASIPILDGVSSCLPSTTM